jgi:hypothetical protein
MVVEESTAVELDEDVLALAERPLDFPPSHGLSGNFWAGGNATQHLPARQVAVKPFRSP